MSSPKMTRMLGLALVWAATGATPPARPTRSAADDSNFANLPLIIGFPPDWSVADQDPARYDAMQRGKRYRSRMEIDLRLLQFAVTLSRYRHFGRAAALGVNQPTLSRNIATSRSSSAC